MAHISKEFIVFDDYAGFCESGLPQCSRKILSPESDTEIWSTEVFIDLSEFMVENFTNQ